MCVVPPSMTDGVAIIISHSSSRCIRNGHGLGAKVSVSNGNVEVVAEEVLRRLAGQGELLVQLLELFVGERRGPWRW